LALESRWHDLFCRFYLHRNLLSSPHLPKEKLMIRPVFSTDPTQPNQTRLTPVYSSGPMQPRQDVQSFDLTRNSGPSRSLVTGDRRLSGPTRSLVTGDRSLTRNPNGRMGMPQMPGGGQSYGKTPAAGYSGQRLNSFGQPFQGNKIRGVGYRDPGQRGYDQPQAAPQGYGQPAPGMLANNTQPLPAPLDPLANLPPPATTEQALGMPSYGTAAAAEANTEQPLLPPLNMPWTGQPLPGGMPQVPGLPIGFAPRAATPLVPYRPGSSSSMSGGTNDTGYKIDIMSAIPNVMYGASSLDTTKPLPPSTMNGATGLPPLPRFSEVPAGGMNIIVDNQTGKQVAAFKREGAPSIEMTQVPNTSFRVPTLGGTPVAGLPTFQEQPLDAPPVGGMGPTRPGTKLTPIEQDKAPRIQTVSEGDVKTNVQWNAAKNRWERVQIYNPGDPDDNGIPGDQRPVAAAATPGAAWRGLGGR
jgi:hypothetical protein